MPRFNADEVQTEIALLVQEAHRAAAEILRTRADRPDAVASCQLAMYALIRATCLKTLLDDAEENPLEQWTIEEILRGAG